MKDHSWLTFRENGRKKAYPPASSRMRGKQPANCQGNTDYLLVIIFSDGRQYLPPLKIIRGLIKAPILILDRQYDSTEKTAAIKAGADEYIKWTDSYLEETIASGLALIRRYTELNQTKQQASSIIQGGNLFINVDYHEVIINSQETEFPRYEFNLLCLLASSPGRVFTMSSFTVTYGVKITCGMPTMGSTPA